MVPMFHDGHRCNGTEKQDDIDPTDESNHFLFFDPFTSHVGRKGRSDAVLFDAVILQLAGRPMGGGKTLPRAHAASGSVCGAELSCDGLPTPLHMTVIHIILLGKTTRALCRFRSFIEITPRFQFQRRLVPMPA
jgi:hypothetical protein